MDIEVVSQHANAADVTTAQRGVPLQALQARAPTTIRPAAVDPLTAPRVATFGQIPAVVVRSATALRARPQTDVHFAWSFAARNPTRKAWSPRTGHAVTLPQFATFAVEDGAGQGMATFSPVQLDQRGATFSLIVEVRQRPRSAATRSDSTPRPRRRGRWQVASTAARSESPNGRACPRPRSPAVRRYPASTSKWHSLRCAPSPAPPRARALGKGHYRLIDQPADSAVTVDNILAPHRERTLRRMRAHDTVLCIQDGTRLNFTRRGQTQGLGAIGVA